MDPIHYDKIADQLMQFRAKLLKYDNYNPIDIRAKWTKQMFREQIDDFLLLIEEYAKIDAKGWLK